MRKLLFDLFLVAFCGLMLLHRIKKINEQYSNKTIPLYFIMTTTKKNNPTFLMNDSEIKINL